MQSETWEVLAPVVTTDTLRLPTKPVIRFRPAIDAEAGLAAWKVDVTRGAHVIKSFTGIGDAPRLVTWDISYDELTLSEDSTVFQYQLTATDTRGKTLVTAPKDITIDRFTVQKKRSERIEDRLIDKYALILFDFDKSDIRGANRRLLTDIRARLKPSSTVYVTGYTDRIGDEGYNKDLSARRATEVLAALGVANGFTAGLGEDVRLFDNELPEGRTFSRTVLIRIETPIEYDALPPQTPPQE
jgi:outer membrane protein OmpA-like peptidoglycan-associated protein